MSTVRTGWAWVGLSAWLGLCSCKQADIPPPPPLPPQELSAASNQGAPSEQARAFVALGDEYIALVERLEPELATRWGLHHGDAELDDRSAAGEAAKLEALTRLLRRVEKLPTDGLSPSERTDAQLLLSALRLRTLVWTSLRPHERRPDYYTEPLSAVFLLLAQDFAPLELRARDALSRIERLPQVVADAKANLQNPPALWVDIGAESAKGAKAFFAEMKPQLLAALPEEKSRIAAAIQRADAAYVDYARFLQRDLKKRAKGEFAVGRELFQQLLRHDYAIEDSPEQLRARGQAVFERTVAELERTAKQVDPAARGWPEVIHQLKGEHPSADQLLPTFRKEVERAREFLRAKDVVSFPADERCEVVETPAFLRGTLIAAYDQPPPFDAHSTGLFYVTPVDPSWDKKRQDEWLRESDYGDIVDTAVHEAYPGHHLQLSVARLHPSRIRKVLDTALFAEGWALYSEELMHELGYYTPKERMLVLEWTLVRAARVLLDVGLHVQGMSFDEAVRFLVEQVHLEPALARSEVKRYTETPTQPLSYLIGREQIFALRERAKARAEARGERFSLKAFHDDLLQRGTVSPVLLEREMFPREAP